MSDLKTAFVRQFSSYLSGLVAEKYARRHIKSSPGQKTGASDSLFDQPEKHRMQRSRESIREYYAARRELANVVARVM